MSEWRRQKEATTNFESEGLLLVELDEKDRLLVMSRHDLALLVAAQRKRAVSHCLLSPSTEAKLTVGPS